MKRLVSVNPATGEEIQSYPADSPREAEERLAATARAQAEWARWPLERRGEVLRGVAADLRREQEALARLMATEMGKPVAQGRAEAAKCAAACEFFAAEAGGFLADHEVKTDAAKSYVRFEPLGVILGIMPWNFPLWQFFRAAAPALMAGNAFLLKHASNVTGCALAIEDLFRRSAGPAGLVSALLVDGTRARRMMANPAIRGVTFTGSTMAGRAVAAAAGKALKKAVLELGGSDAYIVLRDADLSQAAEICAAARLVNSGQSCVAAKRFIVEKPVLEEFTGKFVAAMAARKMGSPLEESTQVGPLARKDLRDELVAQVERSLASGARLLLGGLVPAGLPGAFYPPTVFAGVKPGMSVFDEETFGPVAAIVEAAGEDEAIQLANQSSFGLGAAIFTRDAARGEALAAARIEAGCCFVNDAVRSDSRLPFGGVKDSGFGRELGSFGIREFVNVKTVFVK